MLSSCMALTIEGSQNIAESSNYRERVTRSSSQRLTWELGRSKIPHKPLALPDVGAVGFLVRIHTRGKERQDRAFSLLWGRGETLKVKGRGPYELQCPPSEMRSWWQAGQSKRQVSSKFHFWPPEGAFAGDRLNGSQQGQAGCFPLS